MVVFNDTLGSYGGTHTLMLRMCKWLNDNGITSVVICDSRDNEEIAGKIEDLGTKIICIDRNNLTILKNELLQLMQEETIKVISFIWNYYLDLECIKKFFGLEFDNFIYCVHPETFKKGLGICNNSLREFFIRKYSKIIEKMAGNNAIIMMDEIDAKETNNYNHIHLPSNVTILRLPMICNRSLPDDDFFKRSFKEKTIMTALRAFFPYKGYVIGLISDFALLKGENPTLKLEIVSSGDDYNEILEKIESIDPNFRDDIIIKDWMDYDSLLEEMDNCLFFIGMGTTVLDAALRYKVAIPVKFDTYDNIAEFTIGEKPNYVAAPVESQGRAIKIIENLLEKDYSSYKTDCIENYQSVKRMYDIENSMPVLVSMSNNNKKSILTNVESFRHFLNKEINVIKNRNISHNDYTKLKQVKNGK